MRPKKVSLAAVDTYVVPVSQYDRGYRIQVGGTFVGTYSVEYTNVDIHKLGIGAALWISDTEQAVKTSGTGAIYDGSLTAFRLNVTAYTSGEIEMHVTCLVAKGRTKSFSALYGIDPTDLVAVFDQTRSGAGDVSIWNDLSGNGNHLAQDTAGNQPAIVGNARVFDGTADFMHQQIFASGAVTLANAKKSLVDGAAFIDIGVDLSAHAGADSGVHKRIFKLIDSAGKVAWGYIGASGGGETLVDKINDDCALDNTGDWLTEDCTLNFVAAGADVAHYTMDYVATSQHIRRYIPDVASGILYKLNSSIKDGTLSGYEVFLALYSPQMVLDNANTGVIWNNLSGYGTTAIQNRMTITTALIVGNIKLKDLLLQQVTDCSTDGLHILSTKDGSTQNWTYVDAAFNYNDTGNYTYEIVKSGFNLTGDMAIFWWGQPDDGQPAAEQILCGKMDETNSFMAFGLILDAAGKIVAVASNDGAVRDAFISDAEAFTDGAQAASKLIGMIYTASTGNIDIIVDNAEVASTEQNDVSTAIYDSQVKFQLGKAEDGSFYDGSKTMCLLFGRAPTVAEALAFYNATVGRAL